MPRKREYVAGAVGTIETQMRHELIEAISAIADRECIKPTAMFHRLMAKQYPAYRAVYRAMIDADLEEAKMSNDQVRRIVYSNPLD